MTRKEANEIISDEIYAEYGKHLVDNIYSDFNEAVEAMQEFVERVEAGQVRSSYTYNKFKKILTKLNAQFNGNG